MNIIFQNKGVLSLLDLTTMGDSSKRNDASKIGKFDSGLKYALSILYRNGIKVEIYSGNSKYTFSSKVITDEITGKAKELLVIQEDNAEWLEPKEHVTAFSSQLGYEWKVWMAIRELYSNCLDENGNVQFDENIETPCDLEGTTIIIYNNGMLQEIIDNWNNYFLPNEEPLYSGNSIKIYKNSEGFLRLYKNKILIFEDRNVKSKYIYDYFEASIDEMRLLNNKEAFTNAIVYAICVCNSVNFIRDFISHSQDDCFESKLDYYYTLSKTWIIEVNQRYQELTEFGEVFIVFPGLYQRLIENPQIDVGVKKVKYNSPSYYWADTKVELVKQYPATAKEAFEEDNFQTKILKICSKFNFQVKHPIIESKILGFTCISDVNKKVLYVSKEFSEDKMWEMIKAHFRIDSDDDPDYCFKEYVKQIKLKV